MTGGRAAIIPIQVNRYESRKKPFVVADRVHDGQFGTS